MSLPSPVDYGLAIQTPGISLPPGDLSKCRADLHPTFKTPLSWAGSNAIVFRLRDLEGKPFALRCFTQNIPDAEKRYQAYASFYEKAPAGLKSMLVPLRHYPKGIRVLDGTDSPWKPVVIMAWVEGRQLGSWVEDHRTQPDRLRWLQDRLKELERQLVSASFVHGDLHHKNIMVGPGGPILVDYDSVILPGVLGLQMTTQGLPGFRHPLAGADTPPEAHDRFALLVLHVGLEALACQPALFDQWGKVEGLLFQGADLRNPGESHLFRVLMTHPQLRILATRLAAVCKAPPANTPDLPSFLGTKELVQKTPATTVLPPLNLKQVEALAGLYPQGTTPRLRVHRIEVGGAAMNPVPLAKASVTSLPPVAGTVTSPSKASATPKEKPRRTEARETSGSPLPAAKTSGAALPATGASLASPPQSSVTPSSRLPRRMAFGTLAMLGLLMFSSGAISFRSRNASQTELASIRKDLERQLDAKKEQLLPLIVHLDDELETMRAVPEDLRLATLNPSDGSVKAQSMAHLRHDLATTREQARQALLRCNGVLEDFDGVLREPGLTHAQQAERIASIRDLPQEVQSRIEREFPKGGLP